MFILIFFCLSSHNENIACGARTGQRERQGQSGARGSRAVCQSEVIRGKAQEASGMGQGDRDQWTGRMGHMGRDGPTCGIEIRGIRDRG